MASVYPIAGRALPVSVHVSMAALYGAFNYSVNSFWGVPWLLLGCACTTSPARPRSTPPEYASPALLFFYFLQILRFIGGQVDLQKVSAGGQLERKDTVLLGFDHPFFQRKIQYVSAPFSVGG